MTVPVRRAHCWKARLLISALLVTGVLAGSSFGAGQEIPRFESDILPIFQAKCFSCHGKEPRQAELDLRTLDGLLIGGESGPAILPGSPTQSLLLEKIVSSSMPLVGDKLKQEEIERVWRWIEAGALTAGARDLDPSGRGPSSVTEREVLVTILHVKCLPCHGRRRQEAGLDLRTRASMLKGGESGPVIIPGRPEESLLIQRIVAEEMPPSELQARLSIRPVSSNELEKLRQWIAAGAPAGPEEVLELAVGPDRLVSDKDRQFWSSRPPQRPPVPQVRQKAQVRTPVDAFLLEKLEARGLSFSDEADRLVLMRRAFFDLIGLPPAPEEVEIHLKDHSSVAYEHDRSPPRLAPLR